jgi:hypothetical protein
MQPSVTKKFPTVRKLCTHTVDLRPRFFFTFDDDDDDDDLLLLLLLLLLKYSLIYRNQKSQNTVQLNMNKVQNHVRLPKTSLANSTASEADGEPVI